MVKEDIETIIDRLYDYVNTNGRVSVSASAKAIGLPADQVEKLAVLLENSGLLEMQYTLTQVILVSRSFTQQEAETEGKKNKSKADVVAVETHELEQEVLTAENIIEFMERDMMRRIGRAEALLKQLENTQAFTPGQLDFLKREVETILKQLRMFDTEVRKLGTSETNFEDKVMRFRERVTLLEQRKAAEKKGTVSSLSARMNEAFVGLKHFIPQIKQAQPNEHEPHPSNPNNRLPQIKQAQPNEHEPHPSISNILSSFTLPKIRFPQIKIQQAQQPQQQKRAEVPPASTKEQLKKIKAQIGIEPPKKILPAAASQETKKPEAKPLLDFFKKPVFPAAKKIAPEKEKTPPVIQKAIAKHAPAEIKRVHHAKKRVSKKPKPAVVTPKHIAEKPKHEKHKAKAHQHHVHKTVVHSAAKHKEQKATHHVHKHLVPHRFHHEKRKKEDEGLRVWTDVADIGRKKHHEQALTKQGLVNTIMKGKERLSEANAQRIIEKLEGKNAKKRGNRSR